MKILITGVGSIGLRHFKNLLNLGYHDLVAVDGDKKALEAVLKIKKIPVFQELSVALTKEKPDVVFICTNTASHVPLLKKAISSGADVFVEKPLSHTLAGVKEVVVLARKKKRIVMVGCNYLFHQGIKKLNSILKNNVYGKPVFYRVAIGYYLPDARKNKNYKEIYAAKKNEGGVLMDSGIHAVSYLCSFFGPVKKIFNLKKNLGIIGIQSEEITHMFLEHNSGVTGNVTLDYVSKKAIHLIEITTEKGRLVLDVQKNSLLYFSGKGTPISLYDGRKDQNRMFLDELKHFFSCSRSRKKPLQTIIQAEQMLKIVLEKI